MRRSLFLLALLVAAPLAAQPAATPAPCSVAVIDSAWLASGPVYRDCEVDRPASSRSTGNPLFNFPQELRCVIVELEFVVDSTGRPRPETVRVLSSNSDEYTAALLETVPRWRYRPAQRTGIPVSQAVHVRHARADERLPVTIKGQRPPPRPPIAACR